MGLIFMNHLVIAGRQKQYFGLLLDCKMESRIVSE